jgi:hypothetical protein
MDPLTPNAGRDALEFSLEYNEMVTTYKLNLIEECLIAKNAVFMQCYRLKGGSYGYRGNVITFPQRMTLRCSKFLSKGTKDKMSMIIKIIECEESEFINGLFSFKSGQTYTTI